MENLWSCPDTRQLKKSGEEVLRKYRIAIVITREALTNIPMVESSAFDW